MNRLLVVLLASFVASISVAGEGMSLINPQESGLGLGGGTMFGPVAFCVITQVADDTTPEVGTLGGCSAGTGGNIIKTSASHSGPVAVTTFDGALEGQVLYVHGSGGANATTIANGGNFTLEADWTDAANRVLVLWTVATDTFVEVTRHNGPRTFDGLLNLSNAETIDNANDGAIRFTGVGGSNNEDAILDLETTADTVGVNSGTGVTTWDWGAIGLAAGSADMSDGNITNVGDIQLDSLTADGTSIQTNATTLVLQQNLDLASGDAVTINSEADAELTASSGSQNFVTIEPEILQTGTASYTALKIDATESSVGSAVDYLLSLEVADAAKLTVTNAGVIGGVNAETIDNSTDGSWRMTGVGGTNNEDVEFDLETTADTVTIQTNTGVTTWDWEAIGLAAGSADMSDGNITNVGDIQLDSLTADGTSIQTNATTTIVQQNLDLASGNAITLDSHADAELTAASGVQSFVSIQPEILQTGTAGYIALEVDVTESSEGSVTDYLMSLEVANAAKLTVDSDGALACVDATFSGTAAVDAITPEANNGVGLTGTTITESGDTDTTLNLEHTLNDTGAPDAAEDFTAIKLNVTETDKTGWATVNLIDLKVDTVSKFRVTDAGAVTYGGGLSLGGNLDMNSNAIVEATSLGGSNAETFDNLTDGSWVMTGVGGSNNEDLEIDLEATADTVTLRSSTGVTTWDWEAIGLACGTMDLSEGDLTNAGDLQADSITADGTALQTNSSTLVLQQNDDLASGNANTINSHADAELTASSGSQSFVQIAPEILQTGTAAYTALEVDVTESSEGSATDYLMQLQVADADKFSVDSDGNTVVAGTCDITGATGITADLTLDNTGSSVNSPMVSLKGDSGGTEVEGRIQLIYGADPYVRISVDDDDSTPAMTAVIDIHDAAISFANDNTTDLGASGANRPKDLYLAGNATFGQAGLAMFAGRSEISSSADGYLALTNDAASAFTALTLGPETTSGIRLKVNGDLLELHEGDESSRVSLGAEDIVSYGTYIQAAAGGYYGWNGRSEMYSPADGNILLTNDAATDFGLLQLGGSTASFPAIKRTSARIDIRTANDSAYTDIRLNSLIADTAIRWASSTIMSAPANGDVLFYDSAGTDFSTLKLGGTTSSFPGLQRDGADFKLVLADETAVTDVTAADYKSEGSNGALTVLEAPAGQSLTCDGSGTLTTSGLIPDGAWLVGVTTRVTTALSGGVTAFAVGDGVDPNLWGDQSTVTQGATTDNSDATANWSNPMLAATEVTLTYTGACTGGVVLVVPHFLTVSAPTSN